MSKAKKLFLSVHFVLTLLLIAPFFFGLYATVLFGKFYTEAQAMSAIMLLTVALMLNFGVARAFERDIRTFLGDDK